MNLPGLPTSKGKLLARAKKEEWYAETRIGLGGVRKVFKIPDAYLPGYAPSITSNRTLKEIDDADIAMKASHVAQSAAASYVGVQIDPVILANAIEVVDTYFLNSRKHVTNQRRSEVIVVVYNYLAGNKEDAALHELLKMVA